MSLVLEVDALTAGYGAATALQGVSLTVANGEWIGLLGANGSGKSTLLRCISHLVSQQAGRILVQGIDVAKDTVAARRHIGVAVAPDILPAALTLAQCLDVQATAFGLTGPSDLALEVLETLHLTTQSNKPLGWLTLGLRQRISVTLALVQKPSLLLLDESFNGLDARAAAALESILSREVVAGQMAIVMATHALPLVERCCTSALLLHEGKPVQQWNLRTGNVLVSLETAIARALDTPA